MDSELAVVKNQTKSLEDRCGKADEQFQKLEAMMAGMRITPTAKQSSTAMIGGLASASSPAAAEEWVRQSLLKAGIENFKNIFNKTADGQFNGNIFVKFEDQDQRDDAIVHFNTKKVTNAGKPSFMSPDLPITERIPRSFLFGLKRLLVDWTDAQGQSYRKGCVQIDADTYTLAVDKEDVLKARVVDNALDIEWLSDQWKQWKEFSEDSKFIQLLTEANAKLKLAKERSGKGKGRMA